MAAEKYATQRGLLWSRFFSHLRARAPLAWVLPWFIAGEYAGLLHAALPAALPLVFVPFFLKKQRRVCGLFFASGIILGLWSAPEVSREKFSLRSYRGTVQSDPQYPRTGEVVFSLKRDSGELLRCSAADLPWRNSGAIGIGDKVTVRGKCEALQVSANPFSFDTQLHLRGYSGRCRIDLLALESKGSPSIFFRAREQLVADIRRLAGEGDRSGLLLSLGFGVREALSRETENIFKRTGLAHLLVVSGYQVTLLYQTLFQIILFPAAAWVRFSSRRFFRAAISLPVLAGTAGFVLFTGGEASGVRAVLAGLLCLISRQMERGSSLFNSVLGSLLVLNLLWPGCIFEPGVELTFAALSGICLGIKERRALTGNYLRSCFFATLLSSLVGLLWFGSVSPAGFVLNFIVPPLASIIGCNLAFAAVGLHYAGLDPRGAAVAACIDMLSLLRDALRPVAQLEYALLELEGGAKSGAAAALAALFVLAVFYRMKSYGRDNGLMKRCRAP